MMTNKTRTIITALMSHFGNNTFSYSDFESIREQPNLYITWDTLTKYADIEIVPYEDVTHFTLEEIADMLNETLGDYECYSSCFHDNDYYLKHGREEYAVRNGEVCLVHTKYNFRFRGWK